MSRRSRSRSPVPRGSRPRVRSRSRDRYPTPFDDSTAIAPTNLLTDLQSLVFDYVPEQWDPVQCPSLTDNGAQCRFPYEYRWGGQNRSCARYCLQDVQDLFESLVSRSIPIRNARGDLDSMEMNDISYVSFVVHLKDCNLRNDLGFTTGQVSFDHPEDTTWSGRAMGIYAHLDDQPLQLNTVIHDLVEPAMRTYPQGCILQIDVSIYGDLVPPPSFKVDARSAGLPSYVRGPEIRLRRIGGRVYSARANYTLTIPLGCRAPRTGLRSGERRR